MRALIFAALVGRLGPEPAEDRRVSIVAASSDDPLVTALQGELSTLGMSAEPTIIDGDALTWTQLREVAETQDVAAAIWISPDRSEILIWVDDRGKGRAIVRELPAPTEAEGNDVIVLRAVELLRASLRETQDDPESTPPAAVQPDPPPPHTEREQTPVVTRPRWVAELGPAGAIATGGIGPSLHLAASVRWLPHHVVGVRLQAIAPTFGPRVEDVQGSARTFVGQVLVGPHFSLRPPDKVVQPDLGVAVGVTVMRVDGDAQAPFVGQVDHVVTSATRAGAGIAFVLHPNWGLRLDVAGGIAGPPPTVGFGDREVARWGGLFGQAGVGVEARFGHRP